jgi:PRTRC genetic system protein C
MLITSHLERIFLFKDKGQELELADPDHSMSPEAILNFYSNTYPVLATATIHGPAIENDRVVYRFVSTIGTKG